MYQGDSFFIILAIRPSMEVLESILGIGSQKVIWFGDFNAHNAVWGSDNTDHNATNNIRNAGFEGS